LKEYAVKTGIPLEESGGLLVAWDEEQSAALQGIKTKAGQNGVSDLREVSAKEVYQLEPNLGKGVLRGLLIPGESIICPFSTTIALATEAVKNGVCFQPDFEVEAVEQSQDAVLLLSGSNKVKSSFVINAAGLSSDKIDRLFGFNRFQITPRRGELIVYDKFARDLVSHIILPVPTQTTKGVLITYRVINCLIFWVS